MMPGAFTSARDRVYYTRAVKKQRRMSCEEMSHVIVSRWRNCKMMNDSAGVHTLWQALTKETIHIDNTSQALGVLTAVLRGPAPSMGTPRPSSTRPRVSGPTGTSTIAPVRFTVPPSRISLKTATVLGEHAWPSITSDI